MIAYKMLPVLFLVLLSVYQDDPLSYEARITGIFDGLIEKFDVQYSEENLKEEQSLLINKTIHSLIQSVVLAFMAFAYLSAYVASVIPFKAVDLILLWIAFYIIQAIPWTVVLGLSFLFKDWLEKRKQKEEEKKDVTSK